MADLEDLDLIAPADSLYEGGVKINLIRTRVDALYTVLSSITSVEADQIEAIGTSTISAAQWGYLGACGAGGGQLLAALTASESTQLEAIGTSTISAAQWGYLGACVAGGGQLLAALTASESTQLEAIGTTTISAAQWGYLGACVAGGGQLLAALTTAESTQLEAIGDTTISATQWGYLGACAAGGGQLLAALTTGESDQLELIGATTISAAQWGYLGGCSAILSNIVEDTTPQLGGELDCAAHSVGFTQQTATGDGTTTIDWRIGNKFYFTFGAQADTFTFTAPTHECNLVLVVKQDGTGSRTATWPATVKWPAATAPTLSTGANDVDVICFYWDGTNYHGVASLDFGVPA